MAWGRVWPQKAQSVVLEGECLPDADNIVVEDSEGCKQLQCTVYAEECRDAQYR